MDFIYITPSEVIEHLFCPRFTYFMNVLKVGQHERRRQLVNKGRQIHENKLVTNKEYLRSKVNAESKLLDVYLSSESLMLVGKVDEVLFLKDGTAAPLDYKYAFWEKKIFTTYTMQQTLYAMLIEEHFDRNVDRAFIVYVRSKNHLEQIPITEAMKFQAKKVLDDIFNIISLSQYPNAKKSKRKCEDCTYRNICVA